LYIVCPTKFWGLALGVIKSAIITSLLINSASEGFTKFPSKSKTLDSTPYKTLNNIFIDSSIPLDW